MKQTKTELHTHLLGMLSAKQMLQMIKKYTNYIYWPLNEGINYNSKLVKIDDIINDDSAIEQLSIKHGKQLSYEQLDGLYNSRTAIVNYLISILFLGKKIPTNIEKLFDNDEIKQFMHNNPELFDYNYQDNGVKFIMAMMEYAKRQKQVNKELEQQCKQIIFSDYINRALKELIKMGVEYVEISYSYEDVISMLNIEPEVQDKIKCKFLLSTGRDRSVKQMIESAESLKIALKKGMTVGFDIMGQETQLLDKEKKYSIGKKSYSLKRKLEILIDVLINSNGKSHTLRIHSGESKESFGNTEWVLNTLGEIQDFYREQNPSIKILPPPELRIGHGIYFEPNESYINNLKRFGAIIEINASSNFALGNINEYSFLPYDYYIKNGIPVVLSTDGHGLYDTNIKNEDFIAYKVSHNYDNIARIDDYILEGKIKK